MRIRLVTAVLASALAAAPAALADGGPSPLALVGGTGITYSGGHARLVAIPAGADTGIAAIATGDGRVLRYGEVIGSFGIPTIAFDQVTGGLSHDGRTLVLAPTGFGQPLRASSSFPIVDTRTMHVRDVVWLKGDYSFDALSPDAKTLFLIHHTSAMNSQRYVVRAYDLAANRLLPGRIADKTQRGWTMQGSPMTRVTSGDGRMVYTLYQNYGGYPFVHALDTVTRTAHCIGLPWHGTQDSMWNIRLSLKDGGRTLAVHWRSGRQYLNVDTATYRVSPAGRGFPWLLAVAAAAGAAALAAAAAALARRRTSRAPGSARASLAAPAAVPGP